MDTLSLVLRSVYEREGILSVGLGLTRREGLLGDTRLVLTRREPLGRVANLSGAEMSSWLGWLSYSVAVPLACLRIPRGDFTCSA